MRFIKWLTEKVLPPMYGVFEKGSFPVNRKLKMSQAKSLILEAGKGNRWEKETESTFSFLKSNFLEKNKNRDLLICDYGIGIGRLTLPILRDYPKTKIVGIDESESMLELAKKWLPQVFFDEKRIELLKPDQFFDTSTASPNVRHQGIGAASQKGLLLSVNPEMAYPDDKHRGYRRVEKYQEKTFDLIIAVYVFQHIFLKELRKTLPALHRLLKDDGKLFLVNTFKNDDHLNREVIIKDLLKPYFEKETEISPYERKEKYIYWMGKTGAGYGNWQEMENARPRCQKFMGLYKKRGLTQT